LRNEINFSKKEKWINVTGRFWKRCGHAALRINRMGAGDSGRLWSCL